MTNELQKTLESLEKVNEIFKKKLLDTNQIMEEKDYISDLPEIKEEMENLLHKLNKVNPENIDLVVEILIHLHIKFDNYLSRIELVHNIIKQAITHDKKHV